MKRLVYLVALIAVLVALVLLIPRVGAELREAAVVVLALALFALVDLL